MGVGEGYPTWVTLLCKGHDVDPVQVVFLKEQRIKGSSQEERNTDECQGQQGGGWHGKGDRGWIRTLRPKGAGQAHVKEADADGWLAAHMEL